MYSDINRCFIQYMLTNGCVNYTTATEFITTFLGHTKELEKRLETVVAEINDKISDHFFKIVIRKCEVSGDKICCLINTGNDEISKIPGEFTVTDHSLFENIITEIMQSDAKFISGIFCMNLGPKSKIPISKDLIQKKIDKLCSIGYLEKNEGNIYLGPRAIFEYEDYFKRQFKRRMTTCLCSDFVYFGQICSKCNEVIHNHCLELYKYKGEKCPMCKEPWEPAESREYRESENSEEEEIDGNDTTVDSEDEEDLSQMSQKTVKRRS